MKVGKAYSFKTCIYFDSGVYVSRVQRERLQMLGTWGDRINKKAEAGKQRFSEKHGRQDYGHPG